MAAVIRGYVLKRAFLLALVAAPLSAAAAEITRIASSFDPDHPFGAYLDIAYERTLQKEKLIREYHQVDTGTGQGSVQDVNELWYQMVDSRLKIDAHVGLYQDLDFHFGVPLIFTQDRTWGYVGGTDKTNSTIANNCLAANGTLLDPNCNSSTGTATQAMFGVPAQSYRAGLGDMTFGLTYAFFNTKRDDTKAMWLVGIDYTAPTASLNNPSVITTPTARGGIGDKVHHYTFWTALSKRIGIVDPYFKVHYTLPFRGPGWYSNCDNPGPSNMGAPENCGTGAWSRADTGIRPAHVGGIIFGSEFNAYDEPAHHQKVGIDIRGIATYNSEGRYYNEMSDLFGKYMYTQEYLQVGGLFGFYAHAADYVAFQGTAQVTYNTEHTVTYESIGKDLNGDGTVDVSDPAQHAEVNPNFDWRTDMVSRRFRATQAVVFVLNFTATFSF